MERLKTPFMITAIYLLLLGVATLSPGLTRSVFGYEGSDPGTLRVLSSVFLGFGVVVWAAAGNPQQYGGLASSFVIALAIGALFLLWGWVGGLFTVRNALVPLIINIVLIGWIWTARPKS